MHHSQSQRNVRAPPEPVLRRNVSAATSERSLESRCFSTENLKDSNDLRRSAHITQHSTIRPGMYRREGGVFVATQRIASEHELIAVNPHFQKSSPDTRIRSQQMQSVMSSQGKLSPEPRIRSHQSYSDRPKMPSPEPRIRSHQSYSDRPKMPSPELRVRSHHSGSDRPKMPSPELRVRSQHSGPDRPKMPSPELRVRSRHSGSNRAEMPLPNPRSGFIDKGNVSPEPRMRRMHYTASAGAGDTTHDVRGFSQQYSYNREDSTASSASYCMPPDVIPINRQFSRSSLEAKSRDRVSPQLPMTSPPPRPPSSENRVDLLNVGIVTDAGVRGERSGAVVGRSGSGKRLPPVLRERDRSLRKQQPVTLDDNYTVVVSDGDSTQNAPTWNTYLYQLQQEAPKPVCIQCMCEAANKPPHYGNEYHGSLSRQGAETLLQQGDGCYLVRKSERAPDAVSLAIRFNGETKNYKLFFDGKHYVGEKRFDTIHDLVADGLIHFYIELRAADYIQAMSQESNYEESPYMAYNMKRKRMGKPNSKRDSVNGSTADALSAATLDEKAVPATDVSGYEKPHIFKLQNFIGLHWCDFCANFMWGLLAQGVKCQDCGVQAHKKCSERVPNDCMPDMKYIKRIYGGDLTTVVKANNRPVPCVVEKCVKEIEARGMDQEGVYRLAGFHDDVEAVRLAFDKDAENTDISPNKYDDINTVCSALKLYFRLLPIPLITIDVYNKIIDIVKKDLTDSEVVRQLKDPLMSLPPAHFHTLKYMCSHLSRVVQNQSKNMMSSENLAIVFAPTLMRSDNPNPMQSLIAVKFEQKLMEKILQNHTHLLGKS